MAYTAQPTPIGTSAPQSYSPVPAPAPSSSSSDWNTQWNTIFNQAWNAGYNMGSKPSVSSDFNSAVEQGYSAGMAKRPTTQTVTSPTSYSSVPSSTPQSNVSSGPSSQDMTNDLMSQINSMYDSNNAIFNQMEGNLSSQKATAQSGLNLQGEQQQRSYDSAYSQAKALASTQQNQLDLTARRTDADSLRAFNNLSQSNMSRFGGGSSTGGAVHEVISQEFLRAKGRVQEGYQNAVGKVYEFAQNSLETYNLATTKLKEDINQKLKEVDDAFTSGLLTISQNRVQNETAKSQAKVDLMTQSINNARAIENYRIEAQIQLDQFKAQKTQETNDYLAYAKQLATNTESQAFTDNQNIQNTNSGSFLNYNTSPTQNTAMYKPLQQKTNEDESNNWLNPWV